MPDLVQAKTRESHAVPKLSGKDPIPVSSHRSQGRPRAPSPARPRLVDWFGDEKPHCEYWRAGDRQAGKTLHGNAPSHGSHLEASMIICVA